MQKALVNGRLALAGPNSPKVATCPSCGEVVEKRKRRRIDRTATYFYRHRRGVGEGCPRRYRP